MKVLILSDLHISYNFYTNPSKYKKMLENNIKEKYDIVLIAGDVFEQSIMKTDLNPYEILNYLFNGKLVVFCLGNHEFAHSNINDVLSYWKQKKEQYKNYWDNIRCLDVCDYVDITNGVRDIRVVGNVFWYDFSLNQNTTLMKGEIVEGWLDKTIIDFDPIKENQVCQNKIFESVKNCLNKQIILLTHTVPHTSLNTFSTESPFSIFNAYSGCNDFISMLKSKCNLTYAICGHTHRREMKDILDVHCMNIGNDYYFRSNKIENFLIEV